MKKQFMVAILALVAFVVFVGTPAYAQATRTWVSGVGDDANPCSRTAPCKTFAGAISKTAPAGEINVLDPGGFGAVTITKPITISSQCFEAGVLVSGTNGIVVSVPNATDTVILRGLDIEGLGTGISGVLVNIGGNVTVENSTINNFVTGGITWTPTVSGSQLHVSNTIVRNNGVASNQGILVNPSGTLSTATLDHVRLEHNGAGLKVSSGIADVTESVAANNAFGGFVSTGAGITNLEHSLSTHNANGVVCNAGATVRLGNNSIVDNVGNPLSGAGAFSTYKNNDIDAISPGITLNPINPQ